MDPIFVDEKKVYLKAEVDYKDLQFYYSFNGIDWTKLGDILDMQKISDEHSHGFTGAFVGICCQDPMTMKEYADFDYFIYK